MISSISIENFKCFKNRIDLPLKKINLIYGKNGRGKSTIMQPLLLLSQTMKNNSDLTLLLSEKLADLGNFEDVLNCNSAKDSAILFCISDEKDSLEMTFRKLPGKPQLARIYKLSVNGEDRFIEASSTNTNDVPFAPGFALTVSDLALLQSMKSLRYVSAERMGPRNSSKRNDSLKEDEIGTHGEYIINVLHQQGEAFRNDVAQKLSYVLDGASLSSSETEDGSILLRMDSVDESGHDFKPTNVGFGYSFVLPVLLALMLAERGSIVVIENPEAHLHPGAQSRLMTVMIELAAARDLQLFVETHSDHVVNGLRLAVKDNTCGLTAKDANILFVYHSKDSEDPQVSEIEIAPNGELSEYPDDLLDEWTKQMLGLI